MKIAEIKRHIGAEVGGLDLRGPIDAEIRGARHDALVDHVARVIRDQRFTAGEFQATGELFGELLETAIRPEFVYTHEYRLGDMLLIDNRSAMHKAGFDYDRGQHRMLYRILIRGDQPY